MNDLMLIIDQVPLSRRCHPQPRGLREEGPD